MNLPGDKKLYNSTRRLATILTNISLAGEDATNFSVQPTE